MNADFFSEERRRRINNPTYISGNIFSAFIYPTEMRAPTRMDTQQVQAFSPQKIAPQPSTNSSKTNPEATTQKSKGIRRSQSNLSTYGSNTLFSVQYPPALSDREVQYGQQKKYDIIGLYPYQKIETNPLTNNNKRPQQIKAESSPIGSDKASPRRKGFDPNGYNGISTSEQNNMSERTMRIKYRPFYLNNADEIYL